MQKHENFIGKQKLEVKVDAFKQLLLMRNNMFPDKLVFLVEDVQNAQRAKAKNVHITYSWSSRTLTIENDGAVLTDPQVLFSMTESGWSEDVMESENPFGLGFFSNITVSDYIEVFSGNKRIVFDFGSLVAAQEAKRENPDLLCEEEDHIRVEVLDEYYEGFKLVLHDLKEDLYESEIRERVELLGKYIHDLDMYYNDSFIEKKDLTEGDDSCFQLKIEEDTSFLGWLALNKGWGDSIKVFYKGRLVKTLDNFYLLKGELHINDKVLNLRAPDRSDIMKDKKFEAFKQQIRNYAKKLCEEAILNGDQKDIDEYAIAIKDYVDKKSIKEKLSFLTFKGTNKKDIHYLEGVALAIKSKGKDNIQSLRDYELYLEEEKEEQERNQQTNTVFSLQTEEEGENEASEEEEVEKEEVVMDVQVKKEAPEARGVIEHPEKHAKESYQAAYTERPEVKQQDTKKEQGERIFKEEVPVFWMKFGDIQRYEQKFNIINHYGLKLVIARNRFEEEMLESMKEENVFSISELQEEVKIQASISNTVLNPKEKRASLLLGMISRICGFEENVFVIGDIAVTKTTNVPVINKTYTMVEEEATVVANALENRVFVDRRTIEDTMLEPSEETTLTVADYKFILANLDNFIEEISLLDYDNSEDLYKKTIQELSIA